MTFAETYIPREKGRIYTRDYAGAEPAKSEVGCLTRKN
jgi:hypothetical protein